MTAPTKAIYNLILLDYVRVSSSENKLFDKKDLDESMKKIDIIDYHQVSTASKFDNFLWIYPQEINRGSTKICSFFLVLDSTF